MFCSWILLLFYGYILARIKTQLDVKNFEPEGRPTCLRLIAYYFGNPWSRETSSSYYAVAVSTQKCLNFISPIIFY